MLNAEHDQKNKDCKNLIYQNAEITNDIKPFIVFFLCCTLDPFFSSLPVITQTILTTTSRTKGTLFKAKIKSGVKPERGTSCSR